MTIRQSWVVGCFLAGALFAPQMAPQLAAADKDYEFVEALLNPSGGFGFDEMAADAIKGMGADPTPEGQFDFKLAQTLQLLNIAESSKVSPQKATELMGQAKAILDAICIPDNAKFAHYETASKMRDSLKTKNIDLLISTAKEMDRDDPKKAEEMRGQAAAEYDKLFAESEAEMVKAHETWFPKIKALKDWQDSPAVTGAADEVPVPGDLARGLQDAWTHIMPPLCSWADYGLKAMRYYPKGNARRTEIMTKITTYFLKKAEDEYDINEVVTMTLNEFMGEAYGYVGDNAKMNEMFDEVFGIQDAQWPEMGKKLSGDIKKRAAFFMVSLNMDNKNYKEVETRVVRLLFDNPLILKTDMGKQLTFDLATAKCLLAEGADYEEAKDLILKLMDGMRPDDPWINNARRALSTVLDLAMRHGQMPTMPARRWYDAGRGFFAMASMADNQAKGLVDEGKTAEAAKKAEEARPLFFNAIKFYRNAISAARRGNDTLAQRMAVEPDCWNEMAYAYLRLKLNYEAMLSFKGLVETFRKESLDANVKASRNAEDHNLFTRPTAEQTKMLADVNKKIEEARKFMLSIAGVILQEANTSYNRDIKQEMFTYASAGRGDDTGDDPTGGVLNGTQEYQKIQLVYDQAEG
ncbi:MAG TPA: hypothetical protein VL860_07445, partial [Planctomycetota bacterium]|nr:hypothetical protein [Planctomycetota bacterium]